MDKEDVGRHLSKIFEMDTGDAMNYNYKFLAGR